MELNDLILRSKALNMICVGCQCHSYDYTCSSKCAEYIDVRDIPAVSNEEFEAEAKRRGYKLIKPTQKVKLFPCPCTNKKPTEWFGAHGIFYKCDYCGVRSDPASRVSQAKKNWNALIKHEERSGLDD